MPGQLSQKLPEHIAGYRRYDSVGKQGGDPGNRPDGKYGRPHWPFHGSYWTIAWDALVAKEAYRGRMLPGHAGDFETSMMMSLRPDLVPADRPHRDEAAGSDPRRFQPAWRHERHGFWKQIDGFTDSPDQATAERGAQFREIVVAAVAAAFTEFYAAESAQFLGRI